MQLIFGYLSGFINIFAFIPYVRDIARGTTKPERMSWFIWMILGVIAFVSQYAEGARHSLWMTGVQTVLVVFIFLFSFTRGMGGRKISDLVALGIATLGLLLWYMTKHAAWALVFVIIADAASFSLTMVKAYRHPESETFISWIFYSLAGLCGMLAVGRLDWILLAYPLYIFLNNLVVAAAMLLGKKRAALETT